MSRGGSSPKGAVSTYTYDLLGRRTASTDPDAGASSSTYDANGNVVTATDGTGATTTTVYDRLDRPLRRHTGAPGTSGTTLATWTYDTATNGEGLPASQTAYPSAGSSAAYTLTPAGYDTSGRPTGMTWSVPAGTGVPSALTYSETYGYDAAGHLATVGLPAVGGLPAETVTASWDGRGRPSTLSSSVGGALVASTGYDVLDRLSGRTYGSTSGWSRSYAYDWADRVRGVTTANPAGVLRQDDVYTWTAERLTGVRDAVRG